LFLYYRTQIHDTNWQILNCTTPANFFHALRRQVINVFRKPLIISTPKSLLRDKLAVSSLKDMSEDTNFKRIISERKKLQVSDEKIKKILFCVGKIYYDLLQYREKNKIEDVAIVTIEQLNPFPFDCIYEEVNKYKNSEIIFVQEEPKNMGFIEFIESRFITSIKGPNNDSQDKRIVKYIYRKPSSSPSTGILEVHKREQSELLEKAFK
jgi:2-oxoglutarate dehydrogenase E1 component